MHKSASHTANTGRRLGSADALVGVPHASVVHGQHGGRKFLLRQALVTLQLVMAADPALGVPVRLTVVLALHFQCYQVDLVSLHTNIDKKRISN